LPEKSQPKAVVGKDRDRPSKRDPWKHLRKEPGVKILDIARRSSRER